MLKAAKKLILFVILFAPIVTRSKPVVITPSRLQKVVNPEPHPLRGSDVSDFIAPGCRLKYNGYGGSGTLIYYDKIRREAWVLSCGHLFTRMGGRQFSSRDAITYPLNCQLECFYENSLPLSLPKTYSASICFYRYTKTSDLSLVKFSPEGEPDYFRIAPLDRDEPDVIWSVGCDHLGDIACYEVEHWDDSDNMLVTRWNSPRPGRSGGGLIGDNMSLVGVCCRTSDVSGTGVGYFATLQQIHDALNEEGFGWLLSVPESHKYRQMPLNRIGRTYTCP